MLVHVFIVFAVAVLLTVGALSIVAIDVVVNGLVDSSTGISLKVNRLS